MGLIIGYNYVSCPVQRRNKQVYKMYNVIGVLDNDHIIETFPGEVVRHFVARYPPLSLISCRLFNELSKKAKNGCILILLYRGNYGETSGSSSVSC